MCINNTFFLGFLPEYGVKIVLIELELTIEVEELQTFAETVFYKPLFLNQIIQIQRRKITFAQGIDHAAFEVHN